MTAVAEKTGAWLENLANQPPAPAWLQPLRDAAFARFAELGFPTTHNEECPLTNVAPIARTTFAAGRQDLAGRRARSDKGSIQLFFVNGHLLNRPESLPKGLEAGGLADYPAAAAQHLGKNASRPLGRLS